tara:strand:- start:3225 stop:3575 length:351 start_codon:yes stop_codon:yes gene_type:complete
MANWKQSGSVKVMAFIATKVEVSLSGQGKKISFDFGKASASFGAGGGTVAGEWYVDPKDLPSKVRMRFGGVASGGGGVQMQFIDRKDESKLYGQFIAYVGGEFGSMIDDTVNLKKG